MLSRLRMGAYGRVHHDRDLKRMVFSFSGVLRSCCSPWRPNFCSRATFVTLDSIPVVWNSNGNTGNNPSATIIVTHCKTQFTWNGAITGDHDRIRPADLRVHKNHVWNIGGKRGNKSNACRVSQPLFANFHPCIRRRRRPRQFGSLAVCGEKPRRCMQNPFPPIKRLEAGNRPTDTYHGTWCCRVRVCGRVVQTTPALTVIPWYQYGQ